MEPISMIFGSGVIALANTKAAKELISRAANAVGHIALPLLETYKANMRAKALEIDTIAKNKAKIEDAKVDALIAESHASDLLQRDLSINQELLTVTANRMVSEEIKKQLNMESILAQALPLLQDIAKPDEIDEDWVMKFFNEARNISNEEMQKIWAKLLAEEANSPNKFSKKTISILASMSHQDVLMFESLASAIITLNDEPFLISRMSYNRPGFRDIKLDYLDEIGLIHISSGVVSSGPIKEKPIVKIGYRNKYIGKFHHTYRRVRENRLTKAGMEIYAICSKIIDDPTVLDYLFRRNYYADKPPRAGFNPGDDREFLYINENQ